MRKGNGPLVRFVLTVAGITVGTAMLGSVVHTETAGSASARPAAQAAGASGSGGDAAPADRPGAGTPGAGGQGPGFTLRPFEGDQEDFGGIERFFGDEGDDHGDDEHEHWEGRRAPSRFLRPPADGQNLPPIRSRRS